LTVSPSVDCLGSRFIQAAVRIGIEVCVFARPAHFDEDPQAYAAHEAAAQNRRLVRLAAEEAWLLENGEAPSWPCPPPRRARSSRRSISVVASISPDVSESNRLREPLGV